MILNGYSHSAKARGGEGEGKGASLRGESGRNSAADAIIDVAVPWEPITSAERIRIFATIDRKLTEDMHRPARVYVRA